MPSWFDDNNPDGWQTFDNPGAGSPTDPEMGEPSPGAPPPVYTPPAGQATGQRDWHNTPQGQSMIGWFKSEFQAIHKRPPTEGELWTHLLQHDRLPSALFVRDILQNIRNSAAKPPAPGSSNTPGRQPGQSFRDYFKSLVNGKAYSQQTLKDIEQQLIAAGSKLTPANANNEQTKIWDPDAKDWIRVYGVEGSWDNTWIPQGWGENGPQNQATGGDLIAPWTTPFEYPSFEPPPAFKAPTADEAFGDQGFQFALKQGRDALEKSAAAKGTLLTTGTLKDLDQFSQGAASQQYDKVYGRRLGEYESAYGHAANDWATDYNKALGEYRQSYDIFNNNQDRPYNKLMGLAGLGYQGTQSLLGSGQGYASMYGNTLGNMGAGMGNYWTQGANAAAAGQVGSANAWANGFSNSANMLAPWMYPSLWNNKQFSGLPGGIPASAGWPG